MFRCSIEQGFLGDHIKRFVITSKASESSMNTNESNGCSVPIELSLHVYLNTWISSFRDQDFIAATGITYSS